MKTKRLIQILEKAEQQFPDHEIEIMDGYVSIILKEAPAQEQIDAIPTGEYEEYIAKAGEYEYRYIRIFGD